MRDSLRVLQLRFPAPIPVGHRVEVLWVRRDADAVHFAEAYCVIKDLDSGVEFGMSGDFAALDGGATPSARVCGRVLWCRLVTRGEGGEQHTETRLQVELEPG